jgi:putative glutamine amidotransferase
MSDKPRIGVTRWDDVPDEARDRYWARVVEAGGEVVDIDERAAGRTAEIVPSLDALVLTGGIDVDPATYGASERHAKVREVDGARDDMEIAYLRAALDRDLPVLAICRGHQVLNVGFGGALLQHIDSGEHRADFRTEGHPSRWHDLSVEADSRLASIFDATRLRINSRHHQAVTPETLAPGLRPVAFSDDHGRTLIEGLESEQHRWVVGVQWHPERPEEHEPSFAPAMRRLFGALIAATEKVRR